LLEGDTTHDPLVPRKRRNHAQRLELAAQIKPYGDRGASWDDVGRLFGISGTYAKELYHDPHGEKKWPKQARRTAGIEPATDKMSASKSEAAERRERK